MYTTLPQFHLVHVIPLLLVTAEQVIRYSTSSICKGIQLARYTNVTVRDLLSVDKRMSAPLRIGSELRLVALGILICNIVQAHNAILV